MTQPSAVQGRILAFADGVERRWYSYEQARMLFGLPEGKINVEELSRDLSDRAYTATAGNCGQSAEDDGNGIVITTTW